MNTDQKEIRRSKRRSRINIDPERAKNARVQDDRLGDAAEKPASSIAA
jgi:hypothetical protein